MCRGGAETEEERGREQMALRGLKRLRGWLYWWARFLGDVTAFAEGKLLRRLARKAMLRQAGKAVLGIVPPEETKRKSK